MVRFLLLLHNLKQKLFVVSSGIKKNAQNVCSRQFETNMLDLMKMKEQTPRPEVCWFLCCCYFQLKCHLTWIFYQNFFRRIWKCVNLSPIRICLAQCVPCKVAKPSSVSACLTAFPATAAGSGYFLCSFFFFFLRKTRSAKPGNPKLSTPACAPPDDPSLPWPQLAGCCDGIGLKWSHIFKGRTGIPICHDICRKIHLP